MMNIIYWIFKLIMFTSKIKVRSIRVQCLLKYVCSITYLLCFKNI